MNGLSRSRLCVCKPSVSMNYNLASTRQKVDFCLDIASALQEQRGVRSRIKGPLSNREMLEFGEEWSVLSVDFYNKHSHRSHVLNGAKP